MNIQSKEFIFIIFHKLCQTVSFRGRYLAPGSVKTTQRIKIRSKNMKTMKIWLEKLLFHRFSQSTSDGAFLRSLFIFRNRKKHENNSFLRSLFSFRKRKTNEKNKNMVKRAHFSQATSDGPFLRSLFTFRKH